MIKFVVAVFGLVFSLFLMHPAFSASALTENDVRAFMKQMERATQQRDFDKVISLMSPDIVIHFAINDKTTDLDRTTYYQNAKLNPTHFNNYQYQTRIDSIEISGRQAIVYFTSYEKATEEKGPIYCVMKEASIVEGTKGHLLMTKLNGKGKVSRQPLF